MTRAPRLRQLIWAGLVALAGLPVQAETIRVRAGEHDGFTRLVFEPAKKTGWQLGRVPGGYELRLADPALSFDTSAIFDRVPRRRLADVRPSGVAGVLALAVTCACHATAFETQKGQIVVDVASGPAAAQSRFEKPFAAAGAPPVSANPLPHPKTARATARVQDGMAATLVFRPRQNQDASLPIYWRNIANQTEITPPDTRPALTANPPPGRAKPADRWSPPPAAVTAGHGRTGGAQLRTIVPKPIVPKPIVPDPIVPDPAEVSPAAATGAHLPLPVSDPEVAAIEAEILHQLSRAASQGLVAIDRPTVSGLAGAAAGDTAGQPVGGQPPRAAEKSAASRPDAPGPGGQVEFHAETSMDRDAADNPAARHLTADGARCPGPADLDLAHWGDATAATVQITAARAHLSGEFDRADADAIGKLARLYLYFGMGAEARQTLMAFGVDVAQASLLGDIAQIVDDRPVARASALHGLRDCDTPVALWAFLAAPASDDVRFAEVPAIVRTFSGLPGHLRALLGQRISNRLIEIGAVDAANSVRNAVARQAVDDNRVVGMLDAGIDLENGKADKAERALDRLAESNDRLATDAVLLAIRSRLARGEAIDPKQVETVAALAFEHRNSPDGARFADLEIIARAATGDFAGAFASYERWKKHAPDVGREDTALRLFGLLAAKAPDREFLKSYFARRHLLADTGADLALRLDLGGRLASLGFAEDVRDVLAGEAAHTERGRLQLARAALDLFEPRDALAQLAPLKAADAQVLRAAAYAMLGDHLAAADALELAGAPEAAAEAAWAGGDWARAAQGTEALKAAVTGLGLAPGEPAEASDPHTTLAGSKAALDESAALRQTLVDLLGPPQSVPENPAQ